MAPNPIKNVDGPYGKPKITITNIDRDFYFKYNPELDIIQWSDYISLPRDGVGVPEAVISGQFFTGLPIHQPRIDMCRPNPDVSVSNESWSDTDKCSFNLGLYIFDKNFADIERFVETKKQEDIISYYQKVFCGSSEYDRWSERKKVMKKEEEEEKKRMMRRKLMNNIKNKKKEKNKITEEEEEEKKKKTYVEWDEVFSGKRLRELIARLKISTPDQEMIKSFSESKAFILVDFALLLKRTAGIKNLAEAIAIGEGEKDLTRTDFRRPRSNNQVTTSSRRKIPTGDEWAELGTAEIVKFLRGEGCRLNRDRSVEVFLYAVWPRLLDRGWSSELPADKRRNNSLVFLVPGVDKFSRSDLVNGVDYFDSITDVLGKVEKEPDLMELRADAEAEHGAREDTNDRELGPKQKQAGPVYGEAERGAGKDRNDQKWGRKPKQAGPVYGEAEREAGKDRNDRQWGRKPKQAGPVYGEAGRGAREDRNDQELGRKQKQAGAVDGEGPTKKHRRGLTAGKQDGPRNGGIGSSMSERPAIGTSYQGPAWVESPPAGLANGSQVADARFTVEPSPDELRGARLLFDLNKLPQASDDSENDNEPIMPGNSNK